MLIKAFLKVRKYKEDIKLLMVGKGSDEESLKRLTEELGIKGDVIFTGQVPQTIRSSKFHRDSGYWRMPRAATILLQNKLTY